MPEFLSDPKKFWEWFASIKNWNTPEGWTAKVIIVVLVITGLIWLFRYTLEGALKILKAANALVRRFTLSPHKKLEIKRRQQFCRVLRSDVEVLNKTENWNDQFFTDLEAEVEAEGGFYASAFDRLRGRRSRGLRRERSLIRAIESSAEAALLLVGDPGSGKSVALRHLTIQVAEKGLRSRDAGARVPLYVNLKELPPAPPGGPTADFIKAFVLDNIRRGDADTADYVRENWDAFRERGVWFFLFDSFDEIPAVMHAPRGSPVIQQHAEAIRQFLGGRSDCRGVLASREFKGPDALPWQRFRILPLSQRRQDELIDNSTLPPNEKHVLRRHLADGGITLRQNPLFLTLLCRYVRQEKRPPVNDYDLLERHVLQLAARDPTHTQDRYGLRPEQLTEGATRLAVLFAENPNLSLAPTYDQIRDAWPAADPLIGGLDNLLQALAYVKIGRTDVKEANPGDRRFTFAHRRYQETLFVSYLAKRAGRISPREMLTDLRWREYTVTLLQSQPAAAIGPYCEEAAALLVEQAKAQAPVAALPAYGGHVGYYEWDNVPAVTLLRLLQEGLGARTGVPAALAAAVEAYLGPRWRHGDFYDRRLALEVGGLLPAATLEGWLAEAIRSGGAATEDAAFRQIARLPAMPEELAAWLRARLSYEVVTADSSVKLLKLEALSARLPDSVGAGFVLQRSRAARAYLGLASKPGDLLALALVGLLRLIGVRAKPADPGAAEAENRTPIHDTAANVIVVLTAAGPLLLFLGVESAGTDANPAPGILMAVVGAGLLLAVARFLWLWCYRRLGAKVCRANVLSPFTFQTSFVKELRRIHDVFVPFRSQRHRRLFHVASFLSLGLCVGAYFGAHALGWAELSGAALVNYAMTSWLGLVFLWMNVLLALRLAETWAQQKRLRTLAAQPPGRWPLPLLAGSPLELRVWLRNKPALLLPTEADIRSLGRLLIAPPADNPPAIQGAPLFAQDGNALPGVYNDIADLLSEEMSKRRQAALTAAPPP